ncbi:MAG: UpxY family transcription antiterminator [Dysgonamonadaceae bacterium]|jgi:transcription antitermination factor NusG|nr:UpxY family transcription antiterminator [Dysgonamonadaceae bacterium]
MGTIKSGWYVIYTKPRHEKKVFEDLTLQNCIVYLPLINCLSRWNDRRKMVKKPLFTSYVFVYLNDDASYYRVLSVDGFVTFISFAGKPAMVKDSEIEIIKQLITHCHEIELLQSDIQIGEKRKILFGPLSGYDCEVVSYKGTDKIVARIESLRQDIMAEVPRECLVGKNVFMGM